MARNDVREFLIALSAARVRFLVVGAYALAAHGHVRATGDIDVLVEPRRENARRLERAVRRFGAASLEYFGVSVGQLSRAGPGFYMGVEPDRIDVLTKIAGVGFDRAWRGRLRTSVDGIDVFVLGETELIAAKRASARRRAPGSAKEAQDVADLRWLLARRRPRGSRPRRAR